MVEGHQQAKVVPFPASSLSYDVSSVSKDYRASRDQKCVHTSPYILTAHQVVASRSERRVPRDSRVSAVLSCEFEVTELLDGSSPPNITESQL